MKKIYIYSILFGSSLGYSSLYIFHFFVPFVVFLLSYGLYKNQFKINKNLFLLGVLYIIILFSYFFSEYHDLYLNYILYVSLSFLVLISIYFLTIRDYRLVLRIFIIFSYLQLFFGLMESFNIIRLPFSPYSPYAEFFGKNTDYILDWSKSIMEYNLSKPTGFSGNPNTFGFVALLFAPLLCFYFKNIVYKILFSFGFLILFIKIDSKSLFFCYIFCFFLYYFQCNKVKILLVILSIIILISLTSTLKVETDARIFTIFDEISKGLSMIFSNPHDINLESSTGFRAYLYSTGINKFIESKGLGLGIGGIESYLYETFGHRTAFHNFFLQILVDLGVVGFLIFMFFYLKLIYNLWRSDSMLSNDINHISKILMVIVICAIFSSIAPSGIFYCLPFWAILGFALGIVYLKKI